MAARSAAPAALDGEFELQIEDDSATVHTTLTLIEMWPLAATLPDTVHASRWTQGLRLSHDRAVALDELRRALARAVMTGAVPERMANQVLVDLECAAQPSDEFSGLPPWRC